MLLQTCRACAAFVCLALGALYALPTLADPPAAPVVQTAAQKIALQNVAPGDFIKTLHWDVPSRLPAGVTQVLPVPLQNALLVTATSAGFAKVQEIVKSLDVAPRQVQVTLAIAHASDADLKAAGFDLKDTVTDRYATGPAVARFFQSLAKQGGVGLTLNMTTTDNVDAGMSIYHGPPAPETFNILPHINTDSTVTLAVHPTFSDGGADRKINFRRTVKSGDMVVYVLPSTVPGGSHLLFFARPTIK